MFCGSEVRGGVGVEVWVKLFCGNESAPTLTNFYNSTTFIYIGRTVNIVLQIWVLLAKSGFLLYKKFPFAGLRIMLRNQTTNLKE